jgi:rsbT co-antagonist protein RsbR
MEATLATPQPAARETFPSSRGMAEFWEAYDRHFDEIQTELMRLVERIPPLQAMLKRLTPQQLAEQRRAGRERMHKAVIGGDWEQLSAATKAQGPTYATLGVSFGDWFELVGAFQRILVPHLVAAHAGSPPRLSDSLVAMNAYVDFIMSGIAEEYLKTKERIISQQAASIQELSTPVLQVRDRLLLIPIVGVLDTHRARQLTESLLVSIRAHRALVVVIDITGVAAVDSKVANHLFQTVAAARLMGARTVVSGVSADVAQALVGLGVDVEGLHTVGDLQGGLEEADRMLRPSSEGLEASRRPEAP